MSLSNVLLVYNSTAGFEQSKVAAQAYIAARGLPDNRIGVNFGQYATGNHNPQVTRSQLSTTFSGRAYTATADSFYFNGTKVNSYDGQGIVGAITHMIRDGYAIDGVILSTLTPFQVYEDDGSNGAITMPGYLAKWARWQTARDLTDVLPNGRLGCPATDSEGFGLNEVTRRDSQSVATAATADAIYAEARYNFDKPVMWCSTATANYNTAGDIGSPFGFTPAYNAAQIAALIARGLNVTIDQYALYQTIWSASIAPKVDVFALVEPISYQVGGTPGTLVYSSNFNLLRGAWGCTWFSGQYIIAADWLYNGAAAMFMNAKEPGANGIRNPFLLADYLMRTGNSLMEAIPAAVTVNSYPGGTTYPNGLIDPSVTDYMTVCGDPLYRPYKIRTLPVAAGQPPF